MSHFRFEDLIIWQDAIDLGNHLYDLAEKAENRKLYRFAEQLRGAGMSISNNIAEGSGSSSKKEFTNFLNIARRSIFECANIIIIFSHRSIIEEEEKNIILDKLDTLSKKITAFRKALSP